MPSGTQEYFARIMSDEEFRRRIASAATREEAQALARDAGYEVKRDEAEALRAQIESHRELSEEELAGILGGATDPFETTGATTQLAATSMTAAVP